MDGGVPVPEPLLLHIVRAVPTRLFLSVAILICSVSRAHCLPLLIGAQGVIPLLLVPLGVRIWLVLVNYSQTKTKLANAAYAHANRRCTN